MRETERLAREPVRIGRARGGDDGLDPRVGGPRQDRPDGTHRVPRDGRLGHLGPLQQRAESGQGVGPELAGAQRQRLGRVGAMAADVEGQGVEAGGVEEEGERKGSIACGLPAVDEDDGWTGGAVTGRDEPGGEGNALGLDDHRLVGEADIGGSQVRRVATRVAGADAVGECEPVGQTQRCGGSGSRDPGPADVLPHGPILSVIPSSAASARRAPYTRAYGQTRSA